MIPTVFQDLPLCLICGAVLALSAHRQLAGAGSLWLNRWFRETALFAFLIFLPTGVFFYTQWPDWSWLYYVDASQVPGWAAALTMLSYPLAVLFGFGLTAALVRGDTPRSALAVPAVGAVLLVGVTAAALQRFLVLVRHADYPEAATRALGDKPWVWHDTTWVLTMLGMGVFVGVPLLFLVIRNLRESGAGLLPPVRP